MSWLPTSSTSTAGISVIPSRRKTSFARNRANGKPRFRSTSILTTLRASTNTSPTSIVRSTTDSEYRTNSLRKSGASWLDRLSSSIMPASASTRAKMPSSTWRGLSRNGRRGRGEAGAGAVGRSDGGDPGRVAMSRPPPTE